MIPSQRPETGQHGPAACESGAPAPAAPDHFEAALDELEGIVERMEGGTLTLEQSLGAYRRGAELIAKARRALADVEQQVRVLEAEVLKPFDLGSADES